MGCDMTNGKISQFLSEDALGEAKDKHGKPLVPISLDDMTRGQKATQAVSSHDYMSTLGKLRQKAINKVGRNNPCPCGSGRKYKKCCLQ